MFSWISTSKQALVLDLDQTLIATMTDGSKVPPEIRDNPDVYTITTKEGTYWGLKRPYTDEFLEYCARRFDAIGFWSAGKEGYVHEIVKVLNPPFTPTFIWNFNHCDQVHFPQSQVEEKIQLIPYIWKPLQQIYTSYPQFTRRNTLVLDDRQDYAQENLLNWLEIPPFDPPPTKPLPTNDDYLLRLMDWLDRDDVRESNNILELAKDWY